MIRAAALSIGILSLVLAAGIATAQSQDVEVPGTRIVAEGWLRPLGPGPGLPVDDVPVVTEPVPFHVTGGDTDPLQSCTVDDSLVNDVTGHDTVPCRLERYVNVTEPCESALDNVALVPYVGGTAASTIGDATALVDSNVDTVLDDYSWGDTTTRFSRSCDADVDSLEGSVLQRPSEVIITLDVEVPVCPGFGIPVCESVSQRQAEDEVFEGTAIPLATESCTVVDLKADCGAIDAGDEQVNALEATHAFVDTLQPHGEVRVDTGNKLSRETPAVTPFTMSGNSGAIACTAGGIPDDPGILPGDWGATLTAEPNGELPAGTHDVLLGILGLAFGAFNENAAMLSALTSSTILDAIATVDATWETPMLHDTLHPNHDGSAAHTGCDGTTTPAASVDEVPTVEGLPASSEGDSA